MLKVKNSEKTFAFNVDIFNRQQSSMLFLEIIQHFMI